MNTSKTANLLGALAVRLTDEITSAAHEVSGHGAAAPAALVTLLNSPGLTIGALAGVIGLSHPGTVRLADRLVADSLVTRRKRDDGREVSLVLERKGKRIAEAILATRAATLDSALATIEPSDLVAFDRVVTKLLVALTPDPETADHTCRLCDDRACAISICPIDQSVRSQRVRSVP